jgi:hypothetical protein
VALLNYASASLRLFVSSQVTGKISLVERTTISKIAHCSMNKNTDVFRICRYIIIPLVYLFVAGCELQETNFIKPVPIALQALDVQSTSFIATWKPVLGSSIYVVDVATDPQFSSMVPGYQSRESEGVTLQVTGLTAETTYYYRVRAQKDNTLSDNSNMIQVTTAALTSPVAIPATNVKVFEFTANWTAIEDAASYLVEVATDPDFNTILPNYNSREVVGTSLHVEGLDYRNTYYYRVKAKRLEKTSGYSNVIEVQPCISSSCRLSKLVFDSNFWNELEYDADNMLSTIKTFYYGDEYRWFVKYRTDGKVDSVNAWYDGSIYEKNVYVYNTSGQWTSLYTYSSDDELTFVNDYLYNEQGQLIGFRSYNDEARTSLIMHQDYTVDVYGNVLLITNENGDQTAEFRYEYTFNPKMLIPETVRPFVWDAFSGFDSKPYTRMNNAIYAHGTFYQNNEEEEVFVYEQNSCAVAQARKGFYKVTYEFTGCDF